MVKGSATMSIKDLRTRSKMSRQQFADFFSIPYRTLQNWELGTRDCPEYLLELIEYKLRKEGFICEAATVNVDGKSIMKAVAEYCPDLLK